MKNPTNPACIFLLLTAACGSSPQVEMPAPPPAPFVTVAEIERAAAAAAAAAPPEGPPEVPVLVATIEQAEAALGQRVRVLGTAGDAKLSAVVHSDTLVVYCMERGEGGLLVESRWPEGTIGKQVAVTGTLEWSEQFIADVESDGSVRQGAEGGLWVVTDSNMADSEDGQ